MSKRLLKYSLSLLHVDQVVLNNRWNYRHVISPYYRLYYIDEGEGIISNDGETVQLEAGYIYLIPSFTVCHLHCPEYMRQLFIQFFEDSPDGISLFQHKRTVMKLQASPQDIDNVKRVLAINPGRGINRSDDPRVYEKNAFYKEYEALNNQQNLAVYLETQGILFQLLARFLQHDQPGTVPHKTIPSKILDAMSYVQLNLAHPLTVTLLARRANQHQDYFSRQFLEYTGERPLHYIHSKRIERAQYLMATTNMSYAEIAAQTGFDNVPHFSRIFKKVTQMTPGRYRTQQPA